MIKSELMRKVWLDVMSEMTKLLFLLGLAYYYYYLFLMYH